MKSPADQAITEPRCRRHARPRIDPSERDAWAGPGLAATTPAPRSRLVVSHPATTSITATRATDISSGHQRLSSPTRTCCDQPIGENHDNADSRTSPTARRANTAPSTARVTPTAVRACVISWAETAARAANTKPRAATAEPYSQAALAGKLCARTETATPNPTTTAAPDATMTAAAVPACRPTTAAPSSSVRPTSSSPRVCRTTVNSAISATPINTVSDVS